MATSEDWNWSYKVLISCADFGSPVSLLSKFTKQYSINTKRKLKRILKTWRLSTKPRTHKAILMCYNQRSCESYTISNQMLHFPWKDDSCRRWCESYISVFQPKDMRIPMFQPEDLGILQRICETYIFPARGHANLNYFHRTHSFHWGHVSREGLPKHNRFRYSLCLVF